MSSPLSTGSSFHVATITGSSRLERFVPTLPAVMIRWPTLQTANDIFTHEKPSVSRCWPAVCGLWWDSVLAPRFIHLRAGQTRRLINLKGRQVALNKKNARPILQQDELTIQCSKPSHDALDGVKDSQNNKLKAFFDFFLSRSHELAFLKFDRHKWWWSGIGWSTHESNFDVGRCEKMW